MLPDTKVHRQALIIGNAKYPNAELRNPANDARSFGEKLVALGFQVRTEIDLNGEQFRRAVGEFCRDLAAASEQGVATSGVLFFAGHGVQVDGENYLLPVDGQFRTKLDLKYQTVELDVILQALGNAARTSVVILDCCRDNPLPRTLEPGGLSRSLAGSQGLANVRAPKGTYVAFSTQPHFVALDGTGSHSPFTEALLEYADDPNKFVSEVLMDVRKAVYQKTDGQQIPWDHSALFEPFAFAAADPMAAKGLDEPALEKLRKEVEQGREESYWSILQKSDDIDFIQSFVQQFPNSTHRAAALARIDQINSRAATRKVLWWAAAVIVALLALYPLSVWWRLSILPDTDIIAGDMGYESDEPGLAMSLFNCRFRCIFGSLFFGDQCVALSYDQKDGVCYPKNEAEFFTKPSEASVNPVVSEVMPGYKSPEKSTLRMLWDRALRGTPPDDVVVQRAPLGPGGTKHTIKYDRETDRTSWRTETGGECQRLCSNLGGDCVGFSYSRLKNQCELFKDVKGIVRDADSGLQVHIPGTLSGCSTSIADQVCRDPPPER